MLTFSIDASVAVKWVVEEPGTAEALAVRSGARLLAPDLMAAELANTLWKKVRRWELRPEEATASGRLLLRAGIEFLPTHHLLPRVVEMALELGHPAYDCVYLALAEEHGCRLITADQRFATAAASRPRWQGKVLGLTAAAGLVQE